MTITSHDLIWLLDSLPDNQPANITTLVMYYIEQSNGPTYEIAHLAEYLQMIKDNWKLQTKNEILHEFKIAIDERRAAHDNITANRLTRQSKKFATQFAKLTGSWFITNTSHPIATYEPVTNHGLSNYIHVETP